MQKEQVWEHRVGCGKGRHLHTLVGGQDRTIPSRFPKEKLRHKE